MRILTLAFFLPFFLALPLKAELKIAQVKINHLVKHYHKSIEFNENVHKTDSDIINHPRGKKIQQEIKELKKLAKKIQSGNQSPEESKRLEKLFGTKKSMYEALIQESEELLAELKEDAKEEYAQGIIEIRNKILIKSQETGQKLGYDLVLNSTGPTNSQLPFTLYISDKIPDITQQVIEALNSETPSKTQEQPNPQSTSNNNPE